MADTVSLEQPVGEDGAQLGDFIEDEDAADPVQLTEEMDVADSLRRSIERLPLREGRILALRYGFYDGVPRTLEEIGEEFNLTRERIRQLGEAGSVPAPPSLVRDPRTRPDLAIPNLRN